MSKFSVEKQIVYCSECDEEVEMNVTVIEEGRHIEYEAICPNCGHFIVSEEV